jgi:hypothetical protein
MLEENSQFAFFKKFISRIAILFVALLALFFFCSKKWEGRKNDEKNDCFRMAKVFSELQIGGSLSKDSLEEMEVIVDRRPYLAPKYEQILGLAMLSQQQEERALNHMATLCRRHEMIRGPVQDFAELSLLIEQKEYAKALDLAKVLNIKLENDGEYPSLHACNLLRTIFLAQENHDPLLAKVTWDKLMKHPSWPHFASLFQEEGVTLQDYLNR